MELTSSFDNTLLTKAIRNEIVDQVLNSINDVDINVHIFFNKYGYMLEQDIHFYIDIVERHSETGPYFEEKAKILSIENRKESYNGRKIKTCLFASDLVACINERLNN